MRHLLVTRLVMLLVMLSLTAVWLFARLAGRPAVSGGAPTTTGAAPAPAAPDAGRLFGERCGTCHDAASLAADLAASPDRAARKAEWMSFLPDHAATTGDEADALVRYLEAGAGEAAGAKAP